MDKRIYCIGKIKNGNQEILLAEGKDTPSKRISIVSVKLVRESSFLYKQRRITSPSEAYEMVREFLEEEDRERLIACFVDTKNQPLAINVVSVGSLNSSIVSPREIFKAAILCNSAGLILFHNHPSGDTTPSDEDLKATSRVQECGKLLGIDLLDHIIVGNGSYCSLKEKGII
jgi:DNA repair protein RadC